MGSLDVKFAKLCVMLQRLFLGLLISSMELIFRLIVTRQMWCKCWTVVFLVCNMLALHVLRLELGLIIISHVIVGLTGVLQGYPRLTFSGILPKRVTRGSLKMLELLSWTSFMVMGGNGKASGNISWTLPISGS